MSRETDSVINALNKRALQTENADGLYLIRRFLSLYKKPIEDFNNLSSIGQMNEMNDFWVSYLVTTYPAKDTYEVRKALQIEHSAAIYAENFIDEIVPQIMALEVG